MATLDTQLPNATQPPFPAESAIAEFLDRDSWNDPRIEVDRSFANRLDLTDPIRAATIENKGAKATLDQLGDQLDFMSAPAREQFISNVQASLLLEDRPKVDYAAAQRGDLTGPIGEATRQGKTAAEIANELSGRLDFLPVSDRDTFIKNVQAALESEPQEDIKNIAAVSGSNIAEKLSAPSSQQQLPGQKPDRTSLRNDPNAPANEDLAKDAALDGALKDDGAPSLPKQSSQAEEIENKQGSDPNQLKTALQNEANSNRSPAPEQTQFNSPNQADTPDPSSLDASNQGSGKPLARRAYTLQEQLNAFKKQPEGETASTVDSKETSIAPDADKNPQTVSGTQDASHNPPGTLKSPAQKIDQIAAGATAASGPKLFSPQQNQPGQTPRTNGPQRIADTPKTEPNAVGNKMNVAANREEVPPPQVTAQVNPLAAILGGLRQANPQQRQQITRTPEQETALINNAQGFKERKQQERDQAAVQAAEAQGTQTIQLLNALKNDNTTKVLKDIEQAAKTTPGGIKAVLAETGEGGKYEYLAKEFQAALQEDRFADAYNKATASLATYANQRNNVAEIVQSRPNTALGQLNDIDEKIVSAAQLIPGRDATKTALDEAMEKSKELFQKVVEAIKQTIGLNKSPSASQNAAPSPGP